MMEATNYLEFVNFCLAYSQMDDQILSLNLETQNNYGDPNTSGQQSAANRLRFALWTQRAKVGRSIFSCIRS